ncbi:thiamine pyrophosphate-binding protein [Paenibacillus sp. 7516]|uniref:thiamine pyrophosphate-binding protein n=1 Tax=Paenibacillus sp. 7516 TaxID=2022549 RepID=UPI000BA57572|nr:thiamine pyrophosphate-binding protein [Paenibacillus sp. 7516]PAF29526.1 acetolactate synthase [Paenibacillus sp. 7516]
MKLSDYVVHFIKEQGVSHVFEFIGGAIVHLLDSISKTPEIECISVRHEQGAAFAAEAYARVNGKLGVAMATSGPGSLNLLTGIGSCYFDSVPCLFITGQVNTYEYKFDKPVRQLGFQETDIVSVVKSLTKYAELITDPNMIRYELEKATYLAQNGRPGPVLIDLPMNLQRADIEPEELPSFFNSDEYELLRQGAASKTIAEEKLNEIIDLISLSERPLILAGGGVRSGGAQGELGKFLSLTGIPVVSSLMGLDVVSTEYDRSFGLIGSYGHRYSNLAVANCDLLIILGSRLDSRQTGTRPDTFARAATKIHVDIEACELNAKVHVDIAITASIKVFLTELNTKLANHRKKSLDYWLSFINDQKNKYPTLSFVSEHVEVEPNQFIEKLSLEAGRIKTVCLDVGQHQMWASQSFKLSFGQRLLNSGGMGAMGFALPAAIGAALSSEKEVLVIAGDGGIQLNIQELDTIVRLNLPVKIVVFNNQSLGMVRQFQDLYMNGRKQSTVNPNPDFGRIFQAYDIPSFSITSMDDIDVMKKFFDTTGPAFLEVLLSSNSEVYPKLVVNRPLEDMFPYLDRQALKESMLIDLVDEGDSSS